MPDLNNFQSADHILVRYADTGTYNVYFTKLENQDLTNIANYISSTITIDYSSNKLTNKPDSNHIYSFKPIAFSGKISDLTTKTIGTLDTSFSDAQITTLRSRLALDDLQITLPDIPGIPQDDITHRKFYKEDPNTHEITNEIKDFNPVAVNGVTYDDVVGAPSIAAGTYANQQGQSAVAHDFHKVAFSGEYTDLEHFPDIDGMFANVPTIPSDQVIHDLFFNNIDTGEVDENENPIYEQVVKDFDPIAVNGITYNTLSGAPGIEEGNYADEEGEDPVPHNFHKIAFSGNCNDLNWDNFPLSYSDINGAPELPNRAYQQYIPIFREWTDLPEGEVAPFSNIAFGDLSELTDSTFTNNYIVDISLITSLSGISTMGQENNTSGWVDFGDQGNDSPLYIALENAYSYFKTFNKTVYLKTLNNIYILLDAKQTFLPPSSPGSAVSEFFDSFVFTPYYKNNYETLIANTIDPKETTTNESDIILQQLTLNNVTNKLLVVMDTKDKKCYWKTLNS